MRDKITDQTCREIISVPTGGVALKVDNQNNKLSITGNEPAALFYFSDSWNEDEDYHDVSAEEIAQCKKIVNTVFRQEVKTYTGKHATLNLSYSITYNGKNYGGGTVTTDMNFNYNTIKIPVSNVKLNNGGIIV